MWWNGLSVFEQVTFIMAITATVLLLIFIILMLVGAANDVDFDGGADMDIDSDFSTDAFNDHSLTTAGGLKVFTFRSALVFFCIGGWTAFLFGGVDELPKVWAGVIGGAIGAASAVIVALIFKAMYKIESSGNINYQNGVGKEGVVYLKVPKNLTGRGKINATIQDRFLEITAVTSDDDDIPVGTQVYIIGIADESTVVVSTHKLENKQ
ncbi:hypothetical protein LJC17_03555 [Acholeplasma sp. OttesenSCG-928-E16]|nr:hypothetical protein [Acholeplasma sp. OttesenSCG-928-E16]